MDRTFLAVTVLLTTTSVVVAQDPGYQYFLTGNKINANPITQPGVLLAGGGKDVDAAFRWLIERSGGGDIVVLRAAGGDGYNAYIMGLGKVDSVESIVFNHASAARDPFVLGRLKEADAIFLAGGDQWKYVSLWKDTPIEDAIHDAVRRGVPVGGTSAGLAVLGEFGFSAQYDTITSAQAVANPYDPKVTMATGFLALPDLECLVTDSHLTERDRMGRLLVFLARIKEDSECKQVRGLGLDERTAVLLERDGTAAIVGEGSAYFLRLTNAIKDLRQRNLPQVDVQAVPAGVTFNFRKWRGSKSVDYRLSVQNGSVRSTQSGGHVYVGSAGSR